MKHKHYIIYYLDQNNKEKQRNFDNKEFLTYWFEKYIHTKQYKLIEKVEFNY